MHDNETKHAESATRLGNGANWSRRRFLQAMGLGAIGSATASSFLRNIALADENGEKPNVLFIAIDDLNDWLGCYGGHPQAYSPNIDKLAENGVLFENAQCQAPICTPSRASLLSGRYPSTSGLYFLHPNYRDASTLEDMTTLPQYFMENGYRSYGVGKIFHTGSDPHSFHEYGGTLGGFGPYPEEKISFPTGHPLWDWGAFPDNDEDMPDYKVTEWALDKLKEEPDEPFFLGVGYWRPHVPMYAPPKWFDMFPLDEIVLPPAWEEDFEDIPQYAVDLTHGAAAPRHQEVLDLNEWEHAVQSYLACVAFVDYYVGKVLDALAASPYADNTYIMLWSDHGFHLGEKLRWGKRSLWEESARSPLIIAGPDVVKGARCKRPVGMIDLYPTLVDLCGLPEREELEGNSLRPLLEDPNAEWEQPALTTFGPNNHSLRSERFRYISYADGSEELYDHDNDTHERTNLASNPDYRDVIDDMRQWLPEINREEVEGSGGSDSPIFEDPNPY